MTKTTNIVHTRVVYRTDGGAGRVVVGRLIEDTPNAVVLDLRPGAGTTPIPRRWVVSVSTTFDPIHLPRAIKFEGTNGNWSYR